MKKDSYWFPHDSNAFSDQKIVALVSVYGFAGYGRYWRLLEVLREQTNYQLSIENKFWLTSLADMLKMSRDECEKFINDLVVEFELIKRSTQFIWADSLCNRMQPWDEQKRKMSERGRKGAEATNKKLTAQANEVNGTSETQANEMGGKEREDINKRTINKEDERENGTLSPAHDLKKKYSEVLVTLVDADIKTIWNSLRDFIVNYKPKFCEPYIDIWNVFAKKFDLDEVKKATSQFEKNLLLRLKDPDFDFIGILEVIKHDDFYRGRLPGKDWKITFGWIVKNEDNYATIINKNRRQKHHHSEINRKLAEA